MNRLLSLATWLGGLLLLLWPAIWNRAPLMFGDTTSYLKTDFLTALWSGEPYLYWHRSTLYSLLIYPLHGGGWSGWPVLILNGLTTLWLLQVTLRLNLRRRLWFYSALAVLTPASWQVSYLMPDLTSGLSILALWCLGPHWKNLSRGERIELIPISIWCLSGHTANYLSALVLGITTILWSSRRDGARVLLFLALVACLQLALNYRIYHRVGLQIEQPPFLVARLLEDGPLVRYLQEHGGGFALAGNLEGFPMQNSHILWDENGLVNRTRADKPAIWERLRKEELKMALAVWSTYPIDQGLATMRIIGRQLVTLKVRDMLWTHQALNHDSLRSISPSMYREFAESRQGRWQLTDLRWPDWLFTGSYIASLFALMNTWSRTNVKGRRFILWISLGMLASTAVAAGLSTCNGRYLLRNVWVLALPLACAEPKTRTNSTAPDKEEN